MKAASFEEAWDKAKLIDGWLERNEAEWLYEHACKIKPMSKIIEIGSYHGKSTVLLAHTGHRILTIDPLEPKDDQANNMKITEHDAAILRANISQHPNVTWFKGRSDEMDIKPEPTIGLLYIDGNHQAPHPLNDFLHFEDALILGAYVAFHDAGTFEGVDSAIKDLEMDGDLDMSVMKRIGTRRSMYIGEYI